MRNIPALPLGKEVFWTQSGVLRARCASLNLLTKVTEDLFAHRTNVKVVEGKYSRLVELRAASTSLCLRQYLTAQLGVDQHV